MALPKFDDFLYPILKILSDGKEKKNSQLLSPLSEVFRLSEDDINQKYDSGNGLVFNDRVTWALSYLNLAGALQKPKRGVFVISEEGKLLLEKKDEIKQIVKNKVLSKESSKDKSKKKTQLQEDHLSKNSDLTPAESLYNSFKGIKTSVYREIIDTILSKSPKEFEKLVVQLLQKMGYGGEIKDSGVVTQYTNDKGIDGVIKEDVLGFGRIYIQAKRYSVEINVQRDEIQKFVGALAVVQSDKGVFITTSDFSKGAYEYVQSLNSTAKIVLINGTQLAEYIYDYNLGMQVEKVIEIKKLDSDFWDSMVDDVRNS